MFNNINNITDNSYHNHNDITNKRDRVARKGSPRDCACARTRRPHPAAKDELHLGGGEQGYFFSRLMLYLCLYRTSYLLICQFE